MKTVKKNVYYCDYCKKRNLSAFHMRSHEESCTANPDRKCHLCKEQRDIKIFIEKLKDRFEIKECEPDEFTSHTQEVVWEGKKIMLDEILEFTEGCPNCTLAILRQTRLNYEIFGFKYNYKAELSDWWADKNNEDWRREMSMDSYY